MQKLSKSSLARDKAERRAFSSSLQQQIGQSLCLALPAIVRRRAFPWTVFPFRVHTTTLGRLPCAYPPRLSRACRYRTSRNVTASACTARFLLRHIAKDEVRRYCPTSRDEPSSNQHCCTRDRTFPRIHVRVDELVAHCRPAFTSPATHVPSLTRQLAGSSHIRPHSTTQESVAY